MTIVGSIWNVKFILGSIHIYQRICLNRQSHEANENGVSVNLHQLKLFCAVVETGSFALAGERLHITQPALSIQVRRLEESLRTVLLTRNKKGVTLTDAGKAVYDSAKAIFERAQGLQRQLEEIRSGERGTVSVAISPTGVLYFASLLIQAFKRRFPAAEVIPSIGTREEVLERVSQGTVDLGFEWGPIQHARVVHSALIQARFLVVTSPEHPFAKGRVARVSDFVREPFVDLDHGPGMPSFVEGALLKAGILPKTVLRVPSIDAMKSLIEANLGIGMLSDLSVEREVGLGLLKPLPLEGFPLTRDLVVVSRKDGPPSRATASFLEFASNYRAANAARSPNAASKLRPVGDRASPARRPRLSPRRRTP